MSRPYKFNYKVGDAVVVSPPFANWGIRGVIDEVVVPFTYPSIKTSKEVIYMPSNRKKNTTTRKESYLVKVESNKDANDFFYIWAVQDLVKAV